MLASSGNGVDAAVAADLESLRVEAQQLGVTPDFLLALDPFARAALGGAIGTGPSSGNSADGSSGTVQVGGVAVAPAATASTPAGNADVGGGSGIAGGSSDAADSVGTVQVGGGNSASGSSGTAQASGITAGPAVSVTDTPAGEASIGGSSGIEGGGNTADGSTGTVQTGGVGARPALSFDRAAAGTGTAGTAAAARAAQAVEGGSASTGTAPNASTLPGREPSGTLWQLRRLRGVRPGAKESSSSSASLISEMVSIPSRTMQWQVEQAQTPPQA